MNISCTSLDGWLRIDFCSQELCPLRVEEDDSFSCFMLFRQREVAPPPTRPKPRNPSRQSSYNSTQLDNNGNSAKPPAGYDAESLFTPAYKEMMKVRQLPKVNI